MAYSYSEHPSVGVGQTLPLGFLYEPTSTVRVLVDGVLVPESLYFWSSNTEITTLTGFPAGAVTKVERFTPIDEYNAQNGTSVYDFEGVNLNFQQLLYALQESRDNEDLRQQQIDDIEDTATALALGLAQVDQIKADVEDLAQAAADSAALAATFDPANFYTKGQADARYFTQSQVNTFLSTKADNAITVTGSGLATGGGSLVASRTITVPKATDAESQNRVTPRDDVAVTPKGVALALPAYNRWETIDDLDLVSVAAYIRSDLSAYEDILIEGYLSASANAQIGLQVSTNNGSSFQSTADHIWQGSGMVGASGSDVTNSAETFIPLSITTVAANADIFINGYHLFGFNKARRLRTSGMIGGLNTSPNGFLYKTQAWTATTGPGQTARDAFRIYCSAGVLSGSLHVEGKRG